MDLPAIDYCVGKKPISLAQHSSYNIGGETKNVVFPKDNKELFFLLNYCRQTGLKYFIFGYGANILFPDVPPENTLYISLKYYQWLDYIDDRLFLAAGVPLSFIALLGLMIGKEEMAFTYLLPGSVGGGTFINARCLDKQMSDLLSNVHFLDLDVDGDAGLSQRRISVEDCDYSYKSSIFQQKPWLILGIEIKIPSLQQKEITSMHSMLNLLKTGPNMSSLQEFFNYFSNLARSLGKGDLPESFRTIEDLRIKNEHFKYPSCGSVFKNNYNYGLPMGVLVDRLQLKGMVKGGAMISPYHGNFIINYDKAKASDVVYLIDSVAEKIQESYGFTPELEVINLQSQNR